MFKEIVRRQVVKLFAELNRGNYEPVLNGLAGNFEHWFIGDHALSGRRTTLAVTRNWYERLFRIFPNIRFELHNIVVSGWPWNTVVTVEWSDSYTLLDNQKHVNCGVHVVRLKWGRGVSVRIYCDTALLLQNLAIQQQGGIADVTYAPLIG